MVKAEMACSLNSKKMGLANKLKFGIPWIIILTLPVNINLTEINLSSPLLKLEVYRLVRKILGFMKSISWKMETLNSWWLKIRVARESQVLQSNMSPSIRFYREANASGFDKPRDSSSISIDQFHP